MNEPLPTRPLRMLPQPNDFLIACRTVRGNLGRPAANHGTGPRTTWAHSWARTVRDARGAQLVCAAILALLAPTALSQSPAASPALAVVATEAVRTTLPVRLTANGSIAAWDEASIGAETTGLRLAEVRAVVGDTVRRGDVLAVFASETLAAERAQALAALAQAEVQRAEASSNAARARTLEGTEALSASQLGEFIANERLAQTRVDAARAQIALVEARLAQTRVLAPDAGIIAARGASVGLVPAPGQELFRLIRQARVEWRAEVTADELVRIKPRTMVSVTVAGGQAVTGRVRVAAPTVDPQTRNAIVYVDLPAMSSPEGAQLRPGMFARGQFELGEVSTLVVPQSALAMREGFSYVFRIEGDQRVTQIKVQTGRVSGDRVEIVSGLKGGEAIVASGAGFLNDGDRVRLVPASAPRR